MCERTMPADTHGVYAHICQKLQSLTLKQKGPRVLQPRQLLSQKEAPETSVVKVQAPGDAALLT